jgi:hypothetical protein
MSDNGFLHRPGQFLQRRSWLLDVLRISTILVPREEAPKHTPGWFDSRSVVGVVRFEYTPRLPAAFLIGEVQRVDADAAVAMGRGKIPFDPTRKAFVEGACTLCSSLAHPGIAGRVMDTHWGPGSLTAHMDASRPALFVVSQSWSPGWTASVDGRAAPVVRADALVLGVPVSPGRHEVRLEYHTPGLEAGALISGSTLLGFMLAPPLLWARRRRRRRARRVTARKV